MSETRCVTLWVKKQLLWLPLTVLTGREPLKILLKCILEKQREDET